MKQKKKLLKHCIKIALQGLRLGGDILPNPMVGALITDQKYHILATGMHLGPGTDHAEKAAIKNFLKNYPKSKLEECILFCSLEPCSHTKKRTPPCTPFIIQHNIKRVVLLGLDPNPQVQGKGIKGLKEHGVEVEIISLKKNINKVFFKNMIEEKTYIHLKWAQSIDGKLCHQSGESKWITGPKARDHVKKERAFYDAIMISYQTFLNDRPTLFSAYHCPHKCLVMPRNKVIDQEVISSIQQSELYQSVKKNQKKIFLFTQNNLAEMSSQEKQKMQLKSDPLIVCAPLPITKDGHLDSRALYLDYKICGLYIEPGPGLLTSFLQNPEIDEVSIYINPSFIGQNGLAPFDQVRISHLGDKFALSPTKMKTKKVGDDLHLLLIKKEYTNVHGTH